MGKHSAADDATVHPLVADALSRRTAAPAAAHGERSGGSTGWPGPAPGGGGAVGWPDDTRPAPDGEPQEPADASADRAVTLVAPAARRSWRRLFGARTAA